MQLPVWILKMIIIMISYVDYTTSCTPVRKLCHLRLFSILLIFKFKTRILRFRERRASLVLVLNCPSLCSETLRPPFLDDRWSLNMRQSVRASLVSLYIYILFVCKITSSRHPEKSRFAHWRFDSFCLRAQQQRSGVRASLRRLIRHQWRRRHLRSDRRPPLPSPAFPDPQTIFTTLCFANIKWGKQKTITSLRT